MTALSGKKLFLLDMDGTLYIGGKVLDGAGEFLDAVRSRGCRAMFLTNNSSRGIEGYLAKMRRLGLSAQPEDFLTSVDATIRTLRNEYPGRRCYVFGTRSFCAQLEGAGVDITTEYDPNAEILLCGYDTELTYQKLEDACRLLQGGIPYFIATNADWVCPTEYGCAPDCGSVCEMLWRATGRRPRVIGKPQPEMVYLALEKTGARKEDALMVGDRIYTDIACGVNAGVDTAFVLCGEGTQSDIRKYGVCPTYIFPSMRELAGALRGG